MGEVRAEPVAALLTRRLGDAAAVKALRRLSGGANQETWSLDVEIAGAPLPLILRRTPGGAAVSAVNPSGLTLETEAALIDLAGRSGVPVPGIRCVLEPADDLGSGFVMDRIPGETIARKILRDQAFAEVRPRLARQCGAILAAIHGVAIGDLELAVSPASAQLEQYRSGARPHPVMNVVAKGLSDDDIADLAAWYAGIRVTVEPPP